MHHPSHSRRSGRLWIVTTLVLCIALASGAGLTAGLFELFAADALAGPRPNPSQDRQVTLVVKTLLNQQHLTRHPLDDEISQRGLTTFLKNLDPLKIYFYQSDVDEFMRERDKLDDAINNGDIRFAYHVFNRFLDRIDERVKMVDELLSQQQDFTRDEELVTDRDVLKYPVTPEEARDRWRKRIKYDLLVLKADDKEDQEAREKLGRRYHSFAKRMRQTDSDELLEIYLSAVTSGFDPHTSYMSPSTLENFRIIMKLNLDGIGAALQVEDGYTVVSKVIPGGAADKQGMLKPEDRIVSVGEGETGEMVDVVDMKLGDVVKLIRGKAGTKVRLGVIPATKAETRVYTITRAKIELKDSEARGVIFEEGTKADGTPYRFGIIDLPSFYMDMEGARRGVSNFKSTTRDVRKLLEGFRQQRVDAVVLDLRRNGGGSLTEAINLTGLFIDQGPVVQVKDADGRIQHFDDLDAGMAWDGPLVVLTSKFSASASEILAGAIQDYQRGIVVGDEATHGKGTVQSLLTLGEHLFNIPNPPNLGALKITMQQFYRPNGDSTQKRGVIADVVLPSVSNHMDVAESDLDFAIAFDRVPKASFTTYAMADDATVRSLSELSAARRMTVPEFVDLNKDINRYLEQKTRKRITLNEQKYFEERAELDLEKEEEKQLENQIESSEEIVKRDFYFDEVLRISVDYVKALGQRSVARLN